MPSLPLRSWALLACVVLPLSCGRIGYDAAQLGDAGERAAISNDAQSSGSSSNLDGRAPGSDGTPQAGGSRGVGSDASSGGLDAGASGGGGGVGGSGGTSGGPNDAAAGSGGTSGGPTDAAPDSAPAPSCTDGILNGTETDTDCGGGACPRCPLGGSCRDAADCQSNLCSAGTCVAPDCGDGVENGDETDVDCGGSCSPCAEGQGCIVGGDCQSGSCSGGACDPTSCVAQPSCTCDSFGGHAYMFCTSPATFANSDAVCQATGMLPGRVDDDAENVWIRSRADALGMGPVRIGANDFFAEGQWEWGNGWVDKTVFYTETGGAVGGLFNAWAAGEPSGGQSQDCAVVGTTGSWEAVRCQDPVPFVCELYPY